MIPAAFFNFRAAQSWIPTFAQDQKNYIARTLGNMEDLYPVAGLIGRRYAETASRQSYVHANVELRQIAQDVAGLRRHDLNLSASDEDICAWAQSKAKAGADLCSNAERTDNPEILTGLLAAAQELASRYGFELPDPKDVGILPAMRRAADVAWWRRQARRASAAEVERVAVLLRRVNKAREIYCSDLTVTKRQGQRIRNRKFLEGTTATNEEGQEYTLAELADVSVSNPRLMRMEWMTRLAGFDDVALLMGHRRELWTITAPAECHPWTTAGKVLRENKKWEKSGRLTARAVMDGMCSMWAKFRAHIARRGMKLYGMRVVEANHDGTPHWHAAVYFSPEWMVAAKFSHWPRIPKNAEKDNGKGKTGVEFYPCALGRKSSPRLRAIMRRYALGDMSGYTKDQTAAAKKHRCDFKDVRQGKSAAGYLAKYISKALPADDAADIVQADLYGNPMADSAARVNAWASSHGIRQFQQLGGPSVTVWRELRRATANEACQLDLLDAPKIIQEAADACDVHDWAAFVLVMGGPTVPRKQQLMRPGYWHEHDDETGEIKGRAMTKYGEVPDARIYGVTWETGDLLTRPHTWTIEKTKQAAVEVTSNYDIGREVRDVIRNNPPEWMPWAIVQQERYRAAVEGFGFRFSGAPPGAPLESCQ